MIKSLLICAVVSASAVACSTAGPPRSETRSAAAAPTQPCVPETASRLPMRPGVCSSAPGRSYSNQDLERTGHTDVGDALQMLDPSITVHH
jgi:hypothetical protein